MDFADSSFPVILPKSSLFTDRRLLDVKHNEYAWEAYIPKTIEEWQQRKDFTIEQVKLAAGLLPEIEKIPLQPEVWGHSEYEGIEISKVKLETLPGLLLTGNLFKPASLQSKAPAILCPHGHWEKGRIHNDETASFPMLYLMLARLGFIVFSYDMIGYNDNNNLSHRWNKELADQGALHGVSSFGLQTWNSLRAIDFLCSLPEIDVDRIGCTGASGGASQAWTMALLDERIKVIVPACMLSSHYQGGCQCEEGPLLRLNGVTSFDIVSALAPRPMLLTSVNSDWTNLLPKYEYPALQKVYKLFSAENKLSFIYAEAEHNYNKFTRERVYPWFTHWLLNQAAREKIAEDELEVPGEDLMLHSSENKIVSLQAQKETLQKLQEHYTEPALFKQNSEISFVDWQENRREELSKIINNDKELHSIAMRVSYPSWQVRSTKVQGCLLSRREKADVISAAWIKQEEKNNKFPTFIIVAENHKREFFPGGRHAVLLDMLLNRQCNVLIVELLGSGETAAMLEKSVRDENEPTFHAFNASLFSFRVQDILSSLTLLDENIEGDITLIAAGEAARAALCAMPLAKQKINAFIDLDKVSDSPEAWSSKLSFQPMILKVGGLKTCLLMLAEQQVTICKASMEYNKILETAVQNVGKNCRLSMSSDSLTSTLGRYLGMGS